MAYLTGISTRDAQQIPVVFNNGIVNRIVWKFTLSGDVLANAAHAKPSCSAETVAETLYQVYLTMYHHDNNNFLEEIMAGRPTREVIGGLLFHPPQYTRRAFAALLAYIKPRISIDWLSTMGSLIRKIDATNDLDKSISSFNCQDLFLQLHLYGVHTIDQLSPDNHVDGGKSGNAYLGPVVSVDVAIPRGALADHEKLFMNSWGILQSPAFQLHIEHHVCRVDVPDSYHIFSSTTPMFGDFISSDKITLDQKGWAGKTDLIIRADLPTHVVLNPNGTRRDVDVIIRMMLEPTTMAAFSQFSTGQAGKIFTVNLRDDRYVHLSIHPSDLDSQIKPTIGSADNPPAFEDDVVEVSAPQIEFKSQTFTTRITFRRGEEKQMLSNGISVSVPETTPCTAVISLGKTFKHRCTFPFPISRSR